MDTKSDEPESQEKTKSAPLKLVLKLHRNVNDDVKSKWTVAADNKETPKPTSEVQTTPINEPETPTASSNVAVSGLKIKINRKQLVQVDEETKKKKEVAAEPVNTTKIKIPKEFYSTTKKHKDSRPKSVEKIKKKKRKYDDFESESDSLDEDQMDIASSSDEKELREDAFDLPAEESSPKTKSTRESKSQKTQDSETSTKTSSASKKPRQPLTFQAHLGKILKQLMKRDTLHFFYDPVTDDQAPDYSIIVKNPMDFSTMKKKLESGAYPTLDLFEVDFRLICLNCMLYNAPETIYFKEAKKLLAFGNDILKSWKEKNQPELASQTPTNLTESERVLRSSIQPASPTPSQIKMDTRQSKSADAKLKSIVREASKVQLPTLNQIVQPILSIPTNNAPVYAAPLPAYATTTVPYALFVPRKHNIQMQSETRIDDQDQSASSHYAYCPNYLNYRTKPIPVIKKSEDPQWDLQAFMKTAEVEEKLKTLLSSIAANRAPPVEVDSRLYEFLKDEDQPMDVANVDLDDLLVEANANISREETPSNHTRVQPTPLPANLQDVLDKNTYLLYQLQLYQYERGGGPPSEKEQRIAMQLLNSLFDVSNETSPATWMKSIPKSVSNAMHFLDEMCY